MIDTKYLARAYLAIVLSLISFLVYAQPQGILDLGQATAEALLAFGAGCAAGYTFAMKTALSVAMERIEERDEEIDRLKAKIQNLEAIVFKDLHMRRQGDRAPGDE